jgi:hypothetical protein
VPGVAWCVLTRVSAAPLMPGRGLTCLWACGRWLPVRLPGISLTKLIFRRPARPPSPDRLPRLRPRPARHRPRSSLPSEQPTRRFKRWLMPAGKFSPSPIPRPADSPTCPCAGLPKFPARKLITERGQPVGYSRACNRRYERLWNLDAARSWPPIMRRSVRYRPHHSRRHGG